MPTLKEVLGTPSRKEQVEKVQGLIARLQQKPVAVTILAGNGQYTWNVVGDLHPVDAISLLDTVKNDILKTLAKEEVTSEIGNPPGILDEAVQAGEGEGGVDGPGDTPTSGDAGD